MLDTTRRALIALPPALLIAAAAFVHLVLAFATVGIETDMANFLKISHVLRGELGSSPLDMYSILNPPDVNPPGWPYLPAITPWFVVADSLARFSGLPFHGLVQLPLIAGTMGTAWLCHRTVLGAGGGELRARLALLLVGLGPLYVMVTGWMGQLDSLAFLPALAAALIWLQGDERRWLYAGLLIGLAASVKVVPIFVLVALLPSARSWREAASLVVAAGAIPLLVVAPFLLADFDGVFDALTRYAGLLGKWGLTLFIQPDLSNSWVLGGPPGSPGETVASLQDVARYFTLGALALAGALIAWRRPPVLDACAGLFLILLGLSVNLTYHWLLWPLAFLIAGGRLWYAAYLQGAVFVAQLMLHYGPSYTWLADVYPVYMCALQITVLAGGLVLVARRRRS